MLELIIFGFLSSCILFTIFCVFILFRNDAVFKTRTSFIEDQSLWVWAYHELPAYDEMLYKPKYWKLWTKQQWIRWAQNKVDSQPR